MSNQPIDQRTDMEREADEQAALVRARLLHSTIEVPDKSSTLKATSGTLAIGVEKRRTKAMELAVQWTERTERITTRDLGRIANDIERYIRTGSIAKGDAE